MLPSGVEAREKLKEFIERGYNLNQEIETLKEDLKELAAEVKDELGKDMGKEYPKMLKTYLAQRKIYDRAKNDLDQLAQLDILFKISQGEE